MDRKKITFAALFFAALSLRAADAESVARAGELVNAGRYADAARLYEKLSTADPNNATLHHSLGLCYQSLKDFPRAAAALERATDLSPNPEEPAYSLALLQEALARGNERPGRLAKAREAWMIVAARGQGERARTAAQHLEKINEELAP